MRHFNPFVPLAMFACLVVPAYAGSITIEGHGEAIATPDIAQISSGVMSQAATAPEALEANTAAMTKLIAELKAAGIESRDIQTSNFSVSPSYVYSDDRDANGYTLPPKINGYQVSNAVNVTVRKLDELGTILDKSVAIGANTVNGVTFGVADQSALYDEARKAAFADSLAKAELYATAVGGTLGEIISIKEAQGPNVPQPVAMSAMRDEAAKVPVEAGELAISINVSVGWTLETHAK